MVGSFAGCCARAASGHAAAAPPRSVMNSRRRMSCPQTRPAIYHITGRSGRCASQRNLPAYVGSGPGLGPSDMSRSSSFSPQLRTMIGAAGAAKKVHKRSFDHLGGAGDQGRRKADAERVRRLEIDDELEVRGQLERHVRGPCAA